MIDFRVDTFLTVCNCMNYTKAAVALNITQPAVSQHIHYLEKEYKARFFTYQGKKLQLTEAGKQFLLAARTMKHDATALKEKLAQTNVCENKIAIGTTKTAGQFLLSKPLAKYLQKNPDTLITFIMENTEELFKKLNEGVIDCALIEGSFEKKEYEHLLYSQERFIAVCKKDYNFVKAPQKIDDLLNERLLIREEGSGSRQIFERFLKGKNFSSKDFDKLCEINNVNTIKTLVAEGIGITFIYEFAVREELQQKKLSSLQLEDFNITHEIVFVWRRNSIFAERYKALFEQLRA